MEPRHAALIAAACLIGPTVPGGIVDRRPAEAATALTRMADLLLPWLEAAEPASPSTTSEAPGTEAERSLQQGEETHGSNEGPSPETQ